MPRPSNQVNDRRNATSAGQRLVAVSLTARSKTSNVVHEGRELVGEIRCIHWAEDIPFGSAQAQAAGYLGEAAAMAPKIYLSLTMLRESRRLHYYRAGRLIWIRASKTAFASALTRSGPHMVACTAKPISIGLQPSAKSWRHQRPRSPLNRPRKRSDGRLHVRRPPERSRSPANGAHHTRDASACSAPIRTLSGCHGLGM
jgi:hypothetical protein